MKYPVQAKARFAARYSEPDSYETEVLKTSGVRVSSRMNAFTFRLIILVSDSASLAIWLLVVCQQKVVAILASMIKVSNDKRQKPGRSFFSKLIRAKVYERRRGSPEFSSRQSKVRRYMHGQEEPGRKCTPPDLLTQPPPDLYALYNEEETSHIPSPVVEWFTSYSSLGPSWSGGPAVL